MSGGSEVSRDKQRPWTSKTLRPAQRYTGMGSTIEGATPPHSSFKFSAASGAAEANAVNRVPAASTLISMVSEAGSRQDGADALIGRSSQGKRAFRNGLSQALKAHNEKEKRQLQLRKMESGQLGHQTPGGTASAWFQTQGKGQSRPSGAVLPGARASTQSAFNKKPEVEVADISELDFDASDLI